MKIFKQILIFSCIIISHDFANADSVSNYENINQSIFKTKYGTISVRSSDYGRNIYIGNKKINVSQNDDLYTFRVLSKAELANNIIFVIWGGGGGTMDGDTNIHCKFLTLLDNKRYKISSLTYCPKDSVKLASGVITYNFINPLPYATNNDLGTLNFDGENIKIIKNVHDEKYYKSYYAKSTPYQIYNMLAKDYDQNPLEVINSIKSDKWCHACGTYGVRYCEPFNWMKNPIHDKYYNLLKPICSPPIYENIVSDQTHHISN